MLREIGFFIVLLFPVALVYLSGGLDKGKATNNSKKKKKSKKNKNKAKAVTTQNENNQNEEKVVEEKPKEEPKVEEPKEEEKPMTKTALRKLKQEKKRVEKEALEAKKKLEEEESQEENKKEEKKEEEKVREIDEHMDTTAHYARVMRIQTEEDDDEWEAVPYEEGWSQVKARRPTPSSNSSSPVVSSSGFSTPSQMNSKLDRTAVKNAKKAQKRKEEKAANDALQAERLRKHKKDLEKQKIDEFYSSGAGKNTPWGKNKGSSKRPQATASINEHGSLIWD